MHESEIRQQLVDFCKALHTKNMLAAGDGNLSVCLDNKTIFITPSGKPKAFLEPADIAVMTIDNEVLSGAPSSERLMHLEVYKKCVKARAVVHAHPPTAVAWSVADPSLSELPSTCLSEVILATGSIPFVSYARPGTKQMATVLQPYLPRYRAMILSRHGALSWGESVLEAYMGMERIEHSAEILWKAQSLGGLTHLPEDEVTYLRDLREKIGERLL